MENVYDLVDESRHPLWAVLCIEFGNLQEHKFENVENVFNISQKLVKEHAEEILNVKGVFITFLGETGTSQ